MVPLKLTKINILKLYTGDYKHIHTSILRCSIKQKRSVFTLTRQCSVNSVAPSKKRGGFTPRFADCKHITRQYSVNSVAPSNKREQRIHPRFVDCKHIVLFQRSLSQFVDGYYNGSVLSCVTCHE
jgi:hypothetical protein